MSASKPKKRKRVVCEKCNQELSYSSYLCHRNPLYCPKPTASVNSMLQGTESYAEERAEAIANEGGMDDTCLRHISASNVYAPLGNVLPSGNGNPANDCSEDLDDDSVSCDETNDTEHAGDDPEIVDKIDEVDNSVIFAEDSLDHSQIGDPLLLSLNSGETSSLPEILHETDKEAFGSNKKSESTVADETGIKSDVVAFNKMVVTFLIFFQLVYKVSDRAVECILFFIRSLLKRIAKIISNDSLNIIAHHLPTTIYHVKKLFGFKKDQFRRFVVCPKCSECYEFTSKSDCIRICSTVNKFTGKKCCAPLLRKIKNKDSYKMVPSKVYVYQSLKKSLTKLFQREGFHKLIEHWRFRTTTPGKMSDIYDGSIWKELSSPNEFLSVPYSLSLKLNVDWFKLYEHTNYSVGVIYLTIDNLPRDKRFLVENVIIVGCIPGPREPKLNINSYLKPLVDELLELYHGIQIKTPKSIFSFTSVRCMLTSVSADVPATRKLCGFSSHSAKKGCSKCLKTFNCSHFGAKPDYSGFDKDTWTFRDLKTHQAVLQQLNNARTDGERKIITKEWGIRYSELNRLPYFNIVRQHVIDPMHNLLLGTAKHMVSIWKEEGLLTKDQFEKMQETIDNLLVPANLGRIPHKIHSQASSLTADQWRNWVAIYSTYALHTILPTEHLKCWSEFVKACSILLNPVITLQEIEKGDEMLLNFCRKFEELYGKQKCTPNMHFHCHLKECLLDYGPVYGFWCFPFERFNGIFESFKKNWICPELQIITKFIQYQDVLGSEDMKEDVWLSSLREETKYMGSIQQTHTDYTPGLLELSEKLTCSLPEIKPDLHSICNVSSRKYEKLFASTEVQWLTELYEILYPEEMVKFCPMRYECFHDACVAMGESYTSEMSKGNSSSCISAIWATSLNGQISLSPAKKQAGVIEYLFTHSVVLQNKDNILRTKTVTNSFARVRWYEDHPYSNMLPFPLKVYASTVKNSGALCFLPLCRIMSRCAIKKTTLKFPYGLDNVVVVCPVNRKIHMLH